MLLAPGGYVVRAILLGFLVVVSSCGHSSRSYEDPVNATQSVQVHLSDVNLWQYRGNHCRFHVYAAELAIDDVELRLEASAGVKAWLAPNVWESTGNSGIE